MLCIECCCPSACAVCDGHQKMLCMTNKHAQQTEDKGGVGWCVVTVGGGGTARVGKEGSNASMLPG